MEEYWDLAGSHDAKTVAGLAMEVAADCRRTPPGELPTASRPWGMLSLSRPSRYIPLYPAISRYIPLYPAISRYILLYPTISHYIPLYVVSKPGEDEAAGFARTVLRPTLQAAVTLKE